MNEITTQQDNELIKVLQSSLYPGASEQSIQLVLGYCQNAQLDPMLKPVHIVPMYDSKTRSMRDTVMPGIGMYRVQASRSGDFAGIDEPVFGDDVTEKIGGMEITYPSYCKVTVYRMLNGQKVGFTAVERWKENYAVKGGKDRSIAPNAMWARRPYAQINKCAEAQALRKAFPELGAQPTVEEFDPHRDEEPRDISAEVEVKQEKPIYPQDKFGENFPKWQEMIESGKSTPERVIAMASRRGELSQEQKAQIQQLGSN